MSRRPSYHHGDLRRAIIEASLALVEQAGVRALSLREAARAAGVSHSAPYHHFPDKGSLLAAIAEEGFAELAGAMADARAAAPDAGAGLAACGMAYVRFALRSPAHFRVMFRPELAGPSEQPAVARSSTPALDTLVDAVVAAQAAGAAPAGEPMPLVLTCWSAVHGLASLWLDGPLPRNRRIFGRSPEKLAAIVTSTLSEMLSASAGSSRSSGSSRSAGSAGAGRRRRRRPAPR
jgi:AcrR family transcriptional regulator